MFAESLDATTAVVTAARLVRMNMSSMNASETVCHNLGIRAVAPPTRPLHRRFAEVLMGSSTDRKRVGNTKSNKKISSARNPANCIVAV